MPKLRDGSKSDLNPCSVESTAEHFQVMSRANENKMYETVSRRTRETEGAGTDDWFVSDLLHRYRDGADDLTVVHSVEHFHLKVVHALLQSAVH